MSGFIRITILALVALPGVLNAQPKSPPPKNAEPPTAALVKLSTYPTRIDLDSPRDEQRIGIVGEYADGRTWDLSRTAKLTSANPKIAEVDAAGIVRPVGDGQT